MNACNIFLPGEKSTFFPPNHCAHFGRNTQTSSRGEEDKKKHIFFLPTVPLAWLSDGFDTDGERQTGRNNINGNNEKLFLYVWGKTGACVRRAGTKKILRRIFIWEAAAVPFVRALRRPLLSSPLLKRLFLGSSGRGRGCQEPTGTISPIYVAVRNKKGNFEEVLLGNGSEYSKTLVERTA